MRITAGDGHQASARDVDVVRLVFTADTRTERLCVLLIAFNSCHCITRTNYACRLLDEINAALE